MSEQLKKLKSEFESLAQRCHQGYKQNVDLEEFQRACFWFGKAVAAEQAIDLIDDMLEEQNDE